MEELLRTWDGENVLIRHDAETGAWIFLAVHDRTLGMALGGCRLNIYSSPEDGLRDALRLSRIMTFKWAASGLPFGGGKGVLAVPGLLTPAARERLLLRFADMVDSLGGRYGTGADLGTTARDMNVIGRRTRWVFGRTPDEGGSGDPGPWTALGVLSGIRAACAHVFGAAELTGRTVLIQGLGNVGGPLAQLLATAGAELLVSDAIPTRAAEIAAATGAHVVAPEHVYQTECDVFAPCAIGGILNARSIPRFRCRIVAGSANNQLEHDADALGLHRAAVLYVPDFVINAGGAIAHAGLELLGWDRPQVEARVRGLEPAVMEMLRSAAERAEPPQHEAMRRAERVIASAKEQVAV